MWCKKDNAVDKKIIMHRNIPEQQDVNSEILTYIITLLIIEHASKPKSIGEILVILQTDPEIPLVGKSTLYFIVTF